MRLIDADEFLENARKQLHCCEQCCKCEIEELCNICKSVLNQPAVDIQSVKYGEWIPCKDKIPEDDTVVLCQDSSGAMSVGKVYKNSTCFSGFAAKLDYHHIMFECVAWQHYHQYISRRM